MREAKGFMAEDDEVPLPGDLVEYFKVQDESAEARMNRFTQSLFYKKNQDFLAAFKNERENMETSKKRLVQMKENALRQKLKEGKVSTDNLKEFSEFQDDFDVAKAVAGGGSPSKMELSVIMNQRANHKLTKQEK